MYQQAVGQLQQLFGEGAAFREQQFEAIEAVVAQKRRTLLVQRTGWGKSMVYFIATRLLREAGGGPTILISPLLALMRNQIQAAEQLGLRAASINSTNPDDHDTIESALLRGELDLLLISPERLGNAHFQERVWTTLKDQIGLLVVDEGHCISDWGHDFRPDYRRIMSLLSELPPDTPVLSTTATANDRVVSDVDEILGPGLKIIRGPLTRDSLKLYTYTDPMPAAARLPLLTHLLRNIDGSGIIYCTTTAACQRVAAWLREEGFNAQPYYARVEEDLGLSRPALEDALLNNDLKVLVASTALSMGFDKPDLHFVIHYQLPGSIIAYYQQIGRAGRGIDTAHIILMYGNDDETIQRYFIKTAFPTPEQVENATRAIAKRGSIRYTELEQVINVKRSTVGKILTHLELENIITRNRSDYTLQNGDRTPDYRRWAAVTSQREAELRQMKAYIHHDDCLMRFIASALDDPTTVKPCGRCRNCTGHTSNWEPSTEDVERASRFLRQTAAIEIAPRKRWAAGLPRLNGKISPANKPGYALCRLYDQGFGATVLDGYAAGRFADSLVEHAADVLRRHTLSSSKPPTWVTVIPSSRHTGIVVDFAERLAAALGLPFQNAITRKQPRPPMAEMHNSTQQALNVIGAYHVEPSIPSGPVLLIDDTMQSGWTFTVIGAYLRYHGAAAVYPFALAEGNPAKQ